MESVATLDRDINRRPPDGGCAQGLLLLWLCSYVTMWLCGHVTVCLCGYTNQKTNILSCIFDPLSSRVFALIVVMVGNAKLSARCLAAAAPTAPQLAGQLPGNCLAAGLGCQTQLPGSWQGLGSCQGLGPGQLLTAPSTVGSCQASPGWGRPISEPAGPAGRAGGRAAGPGRAGWFRSAFQPSGRPAGRAQGPCPGPGPC